MEVSSGDLVATAGYSKRMGQLMPDNVVKVCAVVGCGSRVMVWCGRCNSARGPHDIQMMLSSGDTVKG
jgi:hypothetical protein